MTEKQTKRWQRALRGQYIVVESGLKRSMARKGVPFQFKIHGKSKHLNVQVPAGIHWRIRYAAACRGVSVRVWLLRAAVIYANMHKKRP